VSKKRSAVTVSNPAPSRSLPKLVRRKNELGGTEQTWVFDAHGIVCSGRRRKDVIIHHRKAHADAMEE
jgi:hypothetical protein